MYMLLALLIIYMLLVLLGLGYCYMLLWLGLWPLFICCYDTAWAIVICCYGSAYGHCLYAVMTRLGLLLYAVMARPMAIVYMLLWHGLGYCYMLLWLGLWPLFICCCGLAIGRVFILYKATYLCWHLMYPGVDSRDGLASWPRVLLRWSWHLDYCLCIKMYDLCICTVDLARRFHWYGNVNLALLYGLAYCMLLLLHWMECLWIARI